MTGVRIREAGDSALILTLGATHASTQREAGMHGSLLHQTAIDPAVNARAIGAAAAVRERQISGVRDVVSTFHSVAVFVDPLTTDIPALAAALRDAGDVVPPRSTGRLVEVPVTYGGEAGPDLLDVAAFARCTPQDVVERHASRTYRVFMLGFMPGYPYMATVDDRIAVPRRATPRLRIPAGSVGIAGRQTGIYPCESPGGWHIIGRTSLALFDPEATPPARFAPGDEVRFVPVSPNVVSGFSRTGVRPTSATGARRAADATDDSATRFITVLQPGLLTTIQDEGRWGHQSLGVPVAGAMDAAAHRLVNAVLGNPRAAATLEATVMGPELRFEQDVWIALAGGDLGPTVEGRDVPMLAPVRCRAGSVLRFGGRRSGARAYIAVEGGIAAPPVLGSRATHLLSGLGGLGGRALRVGDRLPLGSAGADPQPGLGADLSASAEDYGLISPKRLRKGGPGGPPYGARLRILPGPQADAFDASAFDVLQRAWYTVSPQSDRMGYRLSSGRALPPPAGEMISDAVFMGALQVPPSGEPILLMADRPTTGGYPQLAVVIAADLPLAAQLAPGDWVEFEPCSHAEAIAALRAQEGLFGALR